MVWEDMTRTTLPSWCTLAPPHIGDKGQGKISANGWHVFCMVHLVVMLFHLWGSSPLDSCKNKLLINFCDLVAATKIAARRLITIAHAKEFQDLMLRYLSGLNMLFPMYQLSPTTTSQSIFGNFYLTSVLPQHGAVGYSSDTTICFRT